MIKSHKLAIVVLYAAMAALSVEAQSPHSFTATLNYSGAAAENVPTLLRISPEKIPGFSYSDTADGKDFEIRDENGTLLPYEIDTWDTSGESLLWVKVPSFAGGKMLTVTYGLTSADMTANAADVWSGYTGVWHMNALDANGKYPDSASTRDAEVSSFSKTGQAGKFGQSVQIYTNAWHAAKGSDGEHEKGGVFIPDDGTLDLSAAFTLSGWFNHSSIQSATDSATHAFRYDNIFCKRPHPTDFTTSGFGLRIEGNFNPPSSEKLRLSDVAGTVYIPMEFKNDDWRHLSMTINGNNASIWTNGVTCFSATMTGSHVDNDLPLVVGNTTAAYLDNGGDRAWGGYADEVRLMSGTPSDAYLAAEYAAMANEGIVTYGSLETLSRTLTIDKNTFFSDSVTISSDKPAVSDGVYPIGTTITLTAQPAAGGAFRKWYGDVAKEDRTKPTISFTIAEDMWIYARFVHPWTLSADKTTMTDGNFNVNVTEVNDSKHTLTVGKIVSNPSGPGLLADNTGSGVIDLGGPIHLEGDDTPWVATSLAHAKCTQTVSTNHPGVVRAYISPGTITVDNWWQIFHCGDHKESASYKMIIVDEPAVAQFFDPYLIVNQDEMEKLIFDLPRVTTAADRGNRMFYGLYNGLVNTKFDWWDISSVAEMTNTFFACSWGTTLELYRRTSCKGNLSLPNIRGVDWAPGLGTQLFMMPNVESISLGGATESTTVTNLGLFAFAGDSSLKKLVLHAASDMQVGKSIFATRKYNTKTGTETIDGIEYDVGSQTVSGRVPDEIHFTGQAISSEAIANLLDAATVVDTAAKPVVIYASSLQSGWGGNGVKASWISPATAEECAAYPGEKVIGVYRAGAEAPSGKAVIVHRPNAWDRLPGMAIIFR